MYIKVFNYSKIIKILNYKKVNNIINYIKGKESLYNLIYLVL
jgi:hypothetical protein